MENSQIIALVAIAISVISIGLLVGSVSNLQNILINLDTNVIEQSQTAKSLSQQVNASQQIIDEQRKTISQMNDSISNLTSEIKLLEDRVTSLEKRLYQPYPEPIPQPQPSSLGPCIQIPDNLTNAKLSESNIPTTGLVAEWNFENNALDTSGHGNNGINCGTTFVDGKIGKAASFNGNSIIRIANAPTLNFGTGSFSVSFWLKTTDPSANLIDHRRNNDADYRGWSVEMAHDKIMAEIRSSGSYYVQVFSNKVDDNNYHYIAWVVDKSAQTSKLYIDAKLEDSSKTYSVENIDQNTIGVDIGYTYSPNTLDSPYTGSLDQIRIYDRVLTENEIQSLFNEH